MTRLLTRFFLLSISILWLGLASCNKDKTTTLNGTLVDKHTGEPLDSAKVEFLIQKSESPLFYEDEIRYSDENGKFNFQTDFPVRISLVSKNGYLLKDNGFGLEQEKVNTTTIEMIPKDGVLKLLLNNTGQSDTIYVGIYSQLQESDLGISYGFIVNHPFLVQGLSESIITLNLASEETIDIYWAFSKWPTYSSIKLAPNHDSVFVVRNDTTTFSIIF